jgi:hypothetical protein
MKKIVTLFLLLTTISFAIPDFEKLHWGFNIDAIRGFYPKVKNEFTTGQGVTKYNYFPKDSQIGKITFYLIENQLYKIICTLDPTKVNTDDVKKIYDDFTKRFGEPTSSTIDETYDDFSIKGNSQTWVVKTTYISLIGKDYFDRDNNLNNSELLIEYGLIDPAKRKKESDLNDLILKN